MSYRDKFERYIKGELPEEEAARVEEDIEKVQVIVEHMDEAFEEDRESLNNEEIEGTEDKKGTEDFSKAINRAVNKKLRRYSLGVGALVLAIILFLMYGLSPLMKSRYYDPSKEVGYGNAIDLPLAVYTELHYPFNWFDFSNITDEGYGKYTIEAALQFNGELDYYTFVMNKGSFERIPREWSFLYLPVNAFTRSDNAPRESWMGAEISEVMKDLQELPKSSRVYSAISFKEDITLQEVVDFEKKYGIEFDYIPVRLPRDVSAPYYGVAISTGTIFPEEIYDEAKYPYLELGNYRGEKTGEVLEIHLKSMLSYLIDEGQLLKAMDAPKEEYQKVLDYIEANGAKSFGGALYTSAEKTLEILEDDRVDGVYIEDIKLSGYSK